MVVGARVMRPRVGCFALTTCDYAKRIVTLCRPCVCETGGRRAFDQAALLLF
jgi:hypothetical protein